MTKYFCDYCGVEINKINEANGGASGTRLVATLKNGSKEITVEVLHSSNGTANHGLFCKYCILDALYRLDDRSVPIPKGVSR